MSNNLIEATVQKLIELDNSIEDTKTHKLEEMAEVGRQDYFLVKVFGKEGPVQHFHIFTSDGRKVCLKFKENAYFAHGKYLDKLNNNELKDIMNFMEKPNEKVEGYTNWQVAIFIWNLSNTNKNVQLDNKLQMPNYHNPRYDKK